MSRAKQGKYNSSYKIKRPKPAHNSKPTNVQSLKTYNEKTEKLAELFHYSPCLIECHITAKEAIQMNHQVQIGIFFPRSGQTLYVAVPDHTAERLKADRTASQSNERAANATVQRNSNSFNESVLRAS